MNNFLIIFFLLITSCTVQKTFNTTGSIERIDSAVNEILAPGAKAEIIADGFDWSEGPLWIEKHQMLLFSDVPRNTVYKWTEKNGTEIYLKPSGYTGSVMRGGETGSNGLLLDNDQNLVLCQHGDRRMARLDAPIDNPAPNFISIADKWEGKKFNSPNDAVYTSKGELYFTDPPYGLEKGMQDLGKEIPFQGVYKVKASGEVVLITDTLTRPNGIAFFPGEKRFIIANSDGIKPIWYVFDLNDEGDVINGGIFYDATGYDKSWKGGMDGLKIDRNGNVFATGPGGIWIFNSNGKLLGKLRLNEAASNVALSPDEKTLYITNDMSILRFKFR